MNKIKMYILSLLLLFIFLVILKIDIPLCYGVNCKFTGFKALFSINNIISFISMILIISGIFFYWQFDYLLKGSTNIPFKIQEVENINLENLTFLATYIIPLICINLDGLRSLVVFILLILTIGAIYIKTGIYYTNPSLVLFGYNIYKVSGLFKNGLKENIIVISKNKLTKDMRVSYIQLDENIYYAKPINKGIV